MKKKIIFIDNNNYLKKNFSNEIERILIEIYNKNISIINSGNNSSLNKYKKLKRRIRKTNNDIQIIKAFLIKMKKIMQLSLAKIKIILLI